MQLSRISTFSRHVNVIAHLPTSATFKDGKGHHRANPSALYLLVPVVLEERMYLGLVVGTLVKKYCLLVKSQSAIIPCFMCIPHPTRCRASSMSITSCFIPKTAPNEHTNQPQC